jgi:tRNA(Arg) A34 adenosine deaminase TadA
LPADPLVVSAAYHAGGCFGAVIVKDGKIVGEGYNNVISTNDPTW